MLPLLTALATLASASDLPDPGVRYALELELDPEERLVTGYALIRWQNRSEGPIDRVPVHLYLNGFEGGASTWMSEDRALRRGGFGHYSDLADEEDGWGWTELDRVEQKVDGGMAEVAFAPIAPDDGNPWDRSLVELTLPESVPPGGTLVLDVEFRSRLPVMSPRTGMIDDFVLAGHVVPTIGLLEIPARPPEAAEDDTDAEGPIAEVTERVARWHAHQFHGTTEFMAAFADFDAKITAPAGWSIDGTGALEPRDGEPADGVWTLQQRAVHDFTWVATRGMDSVWVDHERPSGGTIRIHYISPPELADTLERVQHATEGGLDVLDRNLGPYPYDDLTVVIPPEDADASEAVEYATLFLALNGSPTLQRWPMTDFRLPEMVAAHELCHQYFQGLVATDEVENAWLDEGFTDYWSQRIMAEVYGDSAALGGLFGYPLQATALRRVSLRRTKDEPIRDAMWTRPSWLYDRGGWASHSYARSSMVLATLEGVFGRERSDSVMRAWFERGRFRHPTPEDWLETVNEVGGPEMAALAREAITRPDLPNVRVDRIRSKRWKAPLGRVAGPDGTVTITEDDRDDWHELGLPVATGTVDGGVEVQLTEGGWAGQSGRVRVVRLVADLVPGFEPEPDDEEDEDDEGSDVPRLFETHARLEAPGWAHLPIEIAFHFNDGIVVYDTWQTPGVWREYRFVRPGKLRKVVMDPEDKIKLDAWPEDNSKLIHSKGGRADDWASWIGALAGWMSSSMGWWL